MSSGFHAMRWAATVRQSTVPKIVLMVLASRCDDEHRCWPSVASIAADTGLSERSVQNGTAALIEAGLLTRRPMGRNGTLYTLAVPETVDARSARHDVKDAPGACNEPVKDAPAASNNDVKDAPDASYPLKDASGALKDAPGAPKPKKEPKKKSTPLRSVARAQAQAQAQAREPRATRLPEGWWPDAHDRAYAADLGLPVDRLVADFRDYWLAKGGEKARKTDWSRVWQSWCRRDADKLNGRARAPPPRRESAADERRRRLGIVSPLRHRETVDPDQELLLDHEPLS